jgi:hypothetical protein
MANSKPSLRFQAQGDPQRLPYLFRGRRKGLFLPLRYLIPAQQRRRTRLGHVPSPRHHKERRGPRRHKRGSRRGVQEMELVRPFLRHALRGLEAAFAG